MGLLVLLPLPPLLAASAALFLLDFGSAIASTSYHNGHVTSKNKPKAGVLLLSIVRTPGTVCHKVTNLAQIRNSGPVSWGLAMLLGSAMNGVTAEISAETGSR